MNKYRIYIDEVGNNDLRSSKNPNHRYLSLTGVVFDLEYVRNTLSPQIEELKKKFFDAHPDEPLVFHRKELVNKKYPFTKLKDTKISEDFNKNLLRYFSNWDYTVISVVIDKLEHSIKYDTWKYDPYHYCMEILAERFHFYLQEVNSIGDFMVESRGGKEDKRLKKSFRKIMDTGTHYLNADELSSTFTSKELKVKPKSANIAGLQIADLLAYPSRRHILKYFDMLKDDRITFSEEVIKIINNKYYQRGGKLEGYGIKLVP